MTDAVVPVTAPAALTFSIILDLAVSALAIAAFVFMAYRALRRFHGDARSAVLGERHIAYSPAPWKGIFLRCLTVTLLLRLAYFALVLCINHDARPFDPFSILSQALSRWDAPHYLDIAQKGYGTVGEAGYFIVFFPLFPWLTRLMALLTGNVFWGAQLLNWLCSAGACFWLYRLAESKLGGDGAWRAVVWMLVFPTAFYLMLPYSEALFIFLSLAFFYLLERKRYLLAALAGCAAALTRNVGALLAVPLVVAALMDWFSERRPARGYSPLMPRANSRLFFRLCCVALILLGTVGYLLVNHAVYGDALVFLKIQREHWQQGFGWFFQTAALTMRYIVTASAWEVACLWAPQFIVMAACCILLLAQARRVRASQYAYAFVYFFFALSATWLLSGARYMLALFPIFLILAERPRGVCAHVLAAVMAMGQLFLATAHALGQLVF